MTMPSNRRRFLQGLAALPGVAAIPPVAPRRRVERDVYRELGVRPLINAPGAYPALSTPLPVPEVRDALDAAAGGDANLVALRGAAVRGVHELGGSGGA